jgi:alpha-tubulin suppressor-like RCC1 family protein
MALTSEGHVFAWGQNAHGQCGVVTHVTTDDSKILWTPTKVEGLPKIEKLFGGWNHTFALEFAANVKAIKDAPVSKLAVGKKRVSALAPSKAKRSKK